MSCETVKVGEVTAIVCSRGPKPPKKCACGKPGRRLCDWKVGGADARGKQATCSAPICRSCGSSPTWDKDLCDEHTKAWASHPSNPANKVKSEENVAQTPHAATGESTDQTK